MVKTTPNKHQLHQSMLDKFSLGFEADRTIAVERKITKQRADKL